MPCWETLFLVLKEHTSTHPRFRTVNTPKNRECQRPASGPISFNGVPYSNVYVWIQTDIHDSKAAAAPKSTAKIVTAQKSGNIKQTAQP